jgi:hypothetical protein
MMEESIPSVSSQLAIAFALIAIVVIVTGISIFASRIHIVVGVLLEFFSRGFAGVILLAYLFLIAPGLLKIFEEFDLQAPPLFLLLRSLIHSWYFVIPVTFFAVVFNTVIFGVILSFNRNAATIWSAFVSVQVLLCYLVTIFVVLGQFQQMRSLINFSAG